MFFHYFVELTALVKEYQNFRINESFCYLCEVKGKVLNVLLQNLHLNFGRVTHFTQKLLLETFPEKIVHSF